MPVPPHGTFDKTGIFILNIHDRIPAIIAIVQTDITPALNMTITFLTFLSPFTALSILSENKAQTMAAIINNTENFPYFHP